MQWCRRWAADASNRSQTCSARSTTLDNLLLQLQADILGITVVRPVVTETTALGAAYAAGLAAGFWSDPESLRKNWRADRQWEPRWSADQREEAYRGWRNAVERSLDWIDV